MPNFRIGQARTDRRAQSLRDEVGAARLEFVWLSSTGTSGCVNVREHLGIGPFFFGESGAVWLTKELVGPGDVCVDAGANVGHYTFLTAHLAGPTGRVYAFEPNPPMPPSFDDRSS